MSKKEKLLKKLLSKPVDFPFEELVSLLVSLDFELSNNGKTSGSRCKLTHKSGRRLYLHKPHPRNILKPYQILDAIKILKECELI
ncbi:hypothetical protein FACS189465_3180 [Clostridia bacterium]|nr:hypothetical protein FACS189465_3180 [Clostridia bacterium]